MCNLEEYYDIDSEKCLPCLECSTEDSVLTKCSYFADTLCKTDILKGFAFLSNPVPQSSQVPRGSRTIAVEVLPDDWTSNINPTVLMVSGCLCIVSLVVMVFLISFRLWKKYWRQRKEKVIYLTRSYVGYQDPEEGEEPRYQPLPSRDRLKKTSYYSSSIYANDTMLNMADTHIYVNMLNSIDSDYCTIDDYLEER